MHSCKMKQLFKMVMNFNKVFPHWTRIRIWVRCPLWKDRILSRCCKTLRLQTKHQIYHLISTRGWVQLRFKGGGALPLNKSNYLPKKNLLLQCLYSKHRNIVECTQSIVIKVISVATLAAKNLKPIHNLKNGKIVNYFSRQN